MIKEIIPDICIKRVNIFEEFDQVKRRGALPACVVNARPIKASFFDKESFQKEVLEALRNA